MLQRVGLKPDAKYIVFYCADNLDELDPQDKYYESIDLFDAFRRLFLLMT